jgi:dCMP deaminase
MRLTKEQYFMELALATARRSSCLSRQVGAVLVDHQSHVLATGYNGSPRGVENCSDLGVCRRTHLNQGEGLVDQCLAVHAEANALLQCHDVNKVDTVYVNTSPCQMCTRLLLNTSCHVIVTLEIYDYAAVALWLRQGRRLRLFKNWGNR